MMKQLDQALARSSRWSYGEKFHETVRIAATEIHLCGLTATNSTQSMVYAAAAAIGEDPSDRAGFELMERMAIKDAIDCLGAHQFLTYNQDGSVKGHVPHSTVFPTSLEPDLWQEAKSNGVALHRSWQRATSSAMYELIERHVLMKSWISAIGPRQINVNLQEQGLSGLEDLYEIRLYEFAQVDLVGTGQTIFVHGFFLLPKGPDHPLAFGFGAHDNPARSQSKAINEAMQSLGFLWGEEIPSVEPRFAPTPDYHQEFYLYPPHHEQLTYWLGSIKGNDPVNMKMRPEEFSFVDITPPGMEGEMVVLKAMNPNLLRLRFGYPPECGRVVHPIK